MTSFFRKLSWLARRRIREDKLAAELQFHLEEEAEERVAAGMPAQDACTAARGELGNMGLMRGDTRAMWGWTLVEPLVQDLRYGARAVLTNSAVTLLGRLSLRAGIGANTGVY